MNWQTAYYALHTFLLLLLNNRNWHIFCSVYIGNKDPFLKVHSKHINIENNGKIQRCDSRKYPRAC